MSARVYSVLVDGRDMWAAYVGPAGGAERLGYYATREAAEERIAHWREHGR